MEGNHDFRKEYGKLFSKKRDELHYLNGFKISYSLDDFLIEDFSRYKWHPYSVYDLKGNVIETNCEDKNMFVSVVYNWLPYINYVVKEIGVDDYA